MKVRATWSHTFEVTREVEIDEDEYRAWAEAHPGGELRNWAYSDMGLAVFLDHEDNAEVSSEVFADWRIDINLPNDFELVASEVTAVHMEDEEEAS